MAIIVPIETKYNPRGVRVAITDLESFKSAVDKAGGGFKGFSQVSSKVLQSVGRNITDTGKSLTFGLTLPIVGIGLASIATQKDFEVAMNQLAVNTGAPKSEMDKLSALAKQMGSDTVFSANDAADAMLELAKSGFTPAQIEAGALQATMNLASTEGIGLADSATIVAQALNTFGLGAADANSVVDMLAAGSVASSANVTDLAAGLKYAGSTAASMHIPVQDVVTSLAALNSAGIDSTTAGTSLNRMMLGLTGSTEKSSKAIQKYGMDFYNAQGQLKPMPEIISQLDKGLRGLDDQQRAQVLKSIFGVEGMRAANILLKEGAAGYRTLAEEVGKSGVAQEMADARMSGTAGALERLKGSLETAALAIGEAIAPVITSIANFIGGLVDKFTSLSPVAQTVVIVIAAVAAAIGPLLIVLGSLVTAIGAVAGAMAFLAANPIVLAIIGIVAAIAALVAGFVWAYNNVEWFRNGVQAVWQGIQTTIAAVVAWVTGTVWPALQQVWQAVATGAMWLWQSVLVPAWNGIQSAISTVVDWITGTVWPAIQSVWQSIATGATWLWQTVIQPTWDGIYNAVSQVVDSFMTNIWPRMQQVFGLIGQAATALWQNAIQPAWQGIQFGFNILGAAASWLGSVFAAAWNGIMAVLGPVVSFIGGAVGPVIMFVLERIAGAIQFLWSVWATVFSAIFTIVGAVFGWIIDTAGPGVMLVWEGLTKAIGVLMNVYLTSWGIIWNILSTVVGWIVGTLKPVIEAVWNGLVVAVTALWNAYKQYWTFIWNILKSVIEWITGTLWPAIQAAWSGLTTAVSALWNAYKQYWTFIWNILKSVIEWITGTLWPGIQAAWENIKSAVQSLWEKFQSAFNQIKSHVQSVIDTVKSVLRSIGDIVSTVVGYFQSIKDGIVEKFTAAVTFVSGIPGKILAALGSVGSMLWSAGSDLIQGLINGIAARAGDVLSTIASMITDKIPQWVKDRLGIASPSKVMMEVGQWIPMGLAEGIKKRAGDVAKAMRDLAEATTKEAKDAARKALTEAQQAAKDLAKKTVDTIKSSAVAGLESVKVKAREVLDYVKSVRDDIKSFGSVMNTDIADHGGLTAASVIQQMRDRLATAMNFTAMVGQLKKAGLNNSSLQEILKAGPSQGLEIASALVEGGAAAIAQVNQLESWLAQTGTTLGDIGAQSDYGMSASSAQGIVGTSVRVEAGAIVLQFGAGVTAQDSATIQAAVEKAVRDGLADLAREIQNS